MSDWPVAPAPTTTGSQRIELYYRLEPDQAASGRKIQSWGGAASGRNKLTSHRPPLFKTFYFTIKAMEWKPILIIVALNIILPTLDTVTDISLISKLYRGAKGITHPNMATAMLIPFLLSYMACFLTFLRKEKNKKFAFIFALLNIYPQFGMKNY